MMNAKSQQQAHKPEQEEGPSSPFGEPAESGSEAARRAVDAMVEAGLLDRVLAQVDAGQLRLTGEGGFLPEMLKRSLEAGLAAELTGHLGYEKGDPAGSGGRGTLAMGRRRNGSAPRSATSTWPPRETATAPLTRSWSARASAAPTASRR